MLANGNVFFVSYDVTKIGVFDPATNAFSTLTITSCAVANPYCPQNPMGEYRNPPPHPNRCKGTSNHNARVIYSGGLLAPNGKICFTPGISSHVGVLDPPPPSHFFTRSEFGKRTIVRKVSAKLGAQAEEKHGPGV